MEEQVLYRKWRPKSLASIIGQEEIVQILSNSILNNRLSHSFVFSGPSGTGKTSTARVFAKSINCKTAIDNNLSIENCSCKSCEEINNYSSQSIIELDAASSIRQVEDLTEVMLDKINFLPGASKYKVYILDEVHMLSRHSFNALLKTLEEPPGHLIIILVTTDPEKIPQTIMSRCQILEFKSIETNQINDKLIKIATSEQKILSKENAEIIAMHSGGSLRNAENLLEKCFITIKDKNLEKESIEKVLGIINEEVPAKILTHLLDNNLDISIKLLNNLFSKNTNYESILNSFRQLCRNLLHYKYKLYDASNIEKLGNTISIEQIKTISNIVNDLKLNSFTDQKLSLEIMIIDIFDKVNQRSISNQNLNSQKTNNLYAQKKQIDYKTEQIEHKKEEKNQLDSINNNNSNLINNSKQDDLLLKQFIEKFNDTDWAWKIKAITDYNINENTLNFEFTHKSQINYINQEISNPIKLKHFTTAIKDIWNKDLQFNFTLGGQNNNLKINKDNNNFKNNMNNNQISDNKNSEIFYNEVSKYGNFTKLKEIKNES